MTVLDPRTAPSTGTPDTGWVVVGTDGSPGAAEAVRWAADDAHRSGLSLRVLIACDDFELPGAYLPAGVFTDDVDRVESTVLSDLAARHPSLDVVTTSRRGTPPEVLLRAADHATEVVVGSRGAGGFHRLMMGSTSTAVAAACPVPAVVVPQAWSPRERLGSVVMGCDLADHHPAALGYAVSQAVARRTRLRVVAAWRPGGAAVLDHAERQRLFESHLPDLQARLESLVGPVRQEHPDLHLRPEIVHGHPAGQLLDVVDSVGADLLVVGRTVAHTPWSLRIGSTARAVLAHATVPTAVVPEGVTS